MPGKPQNKKHDERLDYISSMLREYRFSYGFTQAQLGEKINKTRQSISRSETSQNISIIFLIDILEVYDITLDEFFSGME